MKQWRDQIIHDQELILKPGEVNYLGHNLELHRCKVVFYQSMQHTILAAVSFVDCEIVFKKRLPNTDWFFTNLTRCTFHGPIVGHDFGEPDDRFNPMRPLARDYGKIEDCDFSKAVLDGVRFFRCDMAQVKLRGWPCFTILQPWEHIGEMREKNTPALLDLAGLYEFSTAQPVAITEYGPEVIRKLGISLEDLRQELEGIDWIKL